MNIINDNKLITYGKKSNLNSFNIHKKIINESENIIFERNLNMLLTLQLKLFDYKIISRADISTKLSDIDMSVEEYLQKLNISKKVMDYYKDFYNCNLKFIF